MSLEANKVVERRFFEVMNERNVAALDKMFADNAVDHSPSPGITPDRNGLKQFFTMTFTAFPDFHSTLEDMVAEGDKVVSRFTARGTHKGEIWGLAPTGKRFAMPGISIHCIVNGKIVDNWVNMDMLSVMQQLGTIPLPTGKPQK